MCNKMQISLIELSRTEQGGRDVDRVGQKIDLKLSENS